MKLSHYALFFLLFPIIAAACADDDSGSCPSRKEGLWRMKWTLRSGSSSACTVPDESTSIYKASDSNGTSLTCSSGCSCSTESHPSSCTTDMTQVCSGYTFSCTNVVTSPTLLLGVCDVDTASASCTYDISISWESKVL